jgi:hypothetical protein
MLALTASIAGCGSTANDANLATTAAAAAAPANAASSGSGRTTDPTESPIARLEPYAPVELSTWGREAPAAERHAVAALVRRYYVALAGPDGVTACSLYHPDLVKAVIAETKFAHSPLHMYGAPTCAAAVARHFRDLYATYHVRPGPSFTAVTVTHVRVKGDEGYAEFHSGVTQNGEIPIRRDGRKWQIYAILGR